MSVVVPTITAENSHQYREQIERVQSFANHLHVDIMDGIFTPNTGTDLSHLWLPKNITCDIHVMYDHPETIVDNPKLPDLSVRTVIVQAESHANFKHIAHELKKLHIQLGISVLAESPLSLYADLIKMADHILIFSGNLGHQGGSFANLDLLRKVAQAKEMNPHAEIGWDGGVNEHNIKQISDAGVAIINVGGYIHHSDKPIEKYRLLQQQIA